MGKYVKVTPKGSKEFHVVLSTNEAFYKSQGASVEDPTQEEIEMFFPEESESKKKTSDNSKAEKLNLKIEALKAELAKKDTEIEALKAELATLKK